MTATEMGYEFDVGYDRITNFDAPGYTAKEKSTFLTKAQEELVLQILNDNSYVEFNKRVVDRLKSSENILAAAMSAGPYTNSRLAQLPETSATRPAIKVINEVAVLTPTVDHFYTGQTFSDVKVKPVDDDYYHMNVNNPHKKPNHEEIWRLDYSDGTESQLLYVTESNTTLTSVRVYYYQRPAPIIILDSGYVAGDGSIDGVALTGHTEADLSCALTESIHREIVDRAIKLAYAALQDEKGFQISSAKERQ